MRRVANIFFFLFGSKALLQLVSEGVHLLTAVAPLPRINSLLLLLCVITGLLLFFGFALQQQLPKSILVPLQLAVVWSLLDYWPLGLLIGPTYSLVAALAELLLLVFLLQLNLQRNKQSRWLVPAQFTDPGFSWRNLQRFILFSVPCLPLLALVLVYSIAANLAAEYSAGFIQLQPNGLYMLEKSYQRELKTIRLTSMIHLGQKGYYEDLNSSISGEKVLVLAEGVSDSSGRLTGSFSYARIAGMLGLAAQEQFPFSGRVVTTESLPRVADIRSGVVDILPADIDLRDFDDHSIAVLNALNRYLLESPSLVDGYRDFSRWAAENMGPETQHLLMRDLLDKRNAVLLSYLPQALAKYDILVIPWGAQHMPGLEKAVTGRGFRLKQVKTRLSVDFFQLPYPEIWQLIWGGPDQQGD